MAEDGSEGTSTGDGDNGTKGAGQDGGGDTTDWKAEAEKWQSQARKHEDRWKQNATAAKELEELKKRSMSDQEKAVAEAKNAGQAEAMKVYGRRLVDAEVRAAVADRQVDVDALLDGLDRSRFLGEDGEPDSKAIKAWVDRIAPKQAGRTNPLAQGARGTRGDSTPDMNSLIRERMRR